MQTVNRGTPKTLDDAILQALAVTNVDQAYFILKDFLSQRFGVAMLLTTDEQFTKGLQILFEEIVRRDLKEKNI